MLGIAWAESEGKGAGGARAGGRLGGGGTATTVKGAATQSEIWAVGVESTRNRIDSEPNMLYCSVEDSQTAKRYLRVVVKQYDKAYQHLGDKYLGDHHPPPTTHQPTNPPTTTTYKPHGYGMITITVPVQTTVLGQSKLNTWLAAM